MRTSDRTIRSVAYLIFALAISVALAACGGGGGGSTSPGTSGPATVKVSIASAPSYPVGTTFAPSTATLSPATAAPPGNSPDFTNVFVTVTKLALIPSTGAEFPDVGGELESPNSPAEEGNGFVTTTFSPVTIDLLNLNSSTGDNVATLLNKFTSVPSGEYSKIRVYYDNVVGQPGNKLFHPTANYHFDVHFVGGNLVIPVTSETHLQGGIRFYSVLINVVGLKYHQAGQSGNILLRPQVFAKMVGVPEYIVSGVAQNVKPANNTFDIDTGGTIVTSVYGSTKWIYIDNTVLPVLPVRRSSDAGIFLGASGLENGAIVDVIGTFASDNVLLAKEVDITFPAAMSDNVYLGWNNADNTITLRFAGDNVVSVPNALRNAVYYDNAVFPYNQLNDLAIMDNVFITARGYKTGDGVKAYWISIGDPIP